MKRPAILMIALLQAVAARGYDFTPSEDVMISMLVLEARRPEQAPAPGESAMDRLRIALSHARMARDILGALERKGGGETYEPEGLARVRRRLAAVEASYEETLWPGLRLLARGLSRGRGISTDAGVLLKERETYAEFSRSGGEEAAAVLSVLDPGALKISSLRELRDEGEASSRQAEELLEKALKRLEALQAEAGSPESFLETVLERAVSELRTVAGMGRDAARRQGDLFLDYARALDALEAYGGADGKGPYGEEDRIKSVRMFNAAGRKLTLLQYTVAPDTRQARVLWNLLDKEKAL